MAEKVAVVTGSNKGLGYGIIRGICNKGFDGIVYLTARDEKRGKEAVEALKQELGENGKKLRFHQLDVTNRESVEHFKDYLVQTHGGLDILVNNAGIFMMVDSASIGERAEKTVGTNYFGTKRACDILFPILRRGARVVNISSGTARLFKLSSEEIKQKLNSSDLTIEDLDGIMNDFIRSANEGKEEKMFPDSTYVMSKIGVTALSMICARQLEKDPRNIIVNACCPGFVATDLNRKTGKLSVDEGADTPVYLALLPADAEGPRGKFIEMRKPGDWTKPKPE